MNVEEREMDDTAEGRCGGAARVGPVATAVGERGVAASSAAQ